MLIVPDSYIPSYYSYNIDVKKDMKCKKAPSESSWG